MKAGVALAVLVGVLAAARPASAAQARFPRGAWNVSAVGGLAFLRMGDVNDLIRTFNGTAQTQFDEIHEGGEWAGALRHAVDDHFFLGLEAGGISATSKDHTSTRELRVRGTPVLAQAGYQIDASDDVAIRAIGGLGALLSARFEAGDQGQAGAGVGRVEGTAALGYAGAEVEVRVSGGVGITAQALLRAALLQHPDDVPYDVDFSGGAVRGGLQFTFGAHR